MIFEIFLNFYFKFRKKLKFNFEFNKELFWIEKKSEEWRSS